MTASLSEKNCNDCRETKSEGGGALNIFRDIKN